MKWSDATRRVILLFAVLALCALFGMGVFACLVRPLPLGEGLLVVQSDVSVPRRVNHLRIDVYDADGGVLESRELAAPSPQDWPISFGVAADAEGERNVTVRLRAYLEGHVVARADLAAAAAHDVPAVPTVSASIQEACANAPNLDLGVPITLRRGSVPITTVLPYAESDGGVPTCTAPTRAGSVAAKIQIVDRDAYRFEIVSAVPDGAHGEPGGDTTLALRKDCAFPTSQLACNDDVVLGSKLSAITAELDPGVYWLVTGGAEPAPADLTLLATRVNAAVPVDAPPAPPSAADRGALEPSPGVAIDRLVRLRLLPGYRGTVPVTLAGECLGTAADLVGSRTCVDRAGALVPVETVLPDGALSREIAPPVPWAGDLAVPCTVPPRPQSALLDEEACVPGGAFVFGDTLALTDLDYRTQPERVRVVAPFLLDRFEFTVARYREALRRGFTPSATDPRPNDGPLTSGGNGAACTWNEGATADVPAPGIDRELYPLTCITWERARALCKFLGADLPTEDQWEYAATAAGRSVETQYPWGADLPTCEGVVVERSDTVANRCAPGHAYGPTVVNGDPWSKKDQTPQGVVGMGGNVQEWTQTGFYRYDHPAWARAGLRDPLPASANENAPLRATRGGDWAEFALFATASARRALPVLGNYTNAGFRCARPGR